MRKINAAAFVTLDGVMQAPGAPQEDVSGNFEYGGWSFHYWDDMMNQVMGGSMGDDFDLLLGRRTFDIFASYWPAADPENPVTQKFNSIRKYVVSNGTPDLSWKGSIQISGNVVEKIQELKKEEGPELLVNGSTELLQTLLANDLIDKLIIWTFPVSIGKGKRLFGDGTKPGSWKLADTKTSTTGVLVSTYEPAGELQTGSF